MDASAAAKAANHVLTMEEIGDLTREEGKPAETLMNVVALIARRFRTDVCSAYLLEPDRANLVLAATLGLRNECVGNAAPGAARRPGGTGSGAGASGGSRARQQTPAVQIFSGGGRGVVSIVPRRAADRPGRAAGRAGGADGDARACSRKTRSRCSRKRRRKWRRW